jgi:uncharacterized protein YndB with AHSA1/START domain
MKDDFEATFVVDLAPDDVWQAITSRALPAEGEGDNDVHYVLPGFPSFERLPMSGASCTQLEVEPGRLLSVKKDHHPCAGTEIAVRLEKADTGTRVTVV